MELGILAGMYFALAIVCALGTYAAVMQARRLYWFMPVYFLAGWLSGELAAIHLIWQIGLTSFLAFFGLLDSALAQTGLAIFTLSWLGSIYLLFQALDTPQILQSALKLGLGEDYRASLTSERRQILRDYAPTGEWLRPFAYKREGVKVHSNIPYADGGKRNLLDVYQPQAPREGGFPVLLQVHGGGWMIGDKEQQGKPLMNHLAQRGWLCVSINYRLSPKAAFPAHIIDVKKAIAWIRDNIAEYGGNPDFIAVTGGSAGGHLSSLAALTPNRAEWQPEFEATDTSIQAAVPLYGVYDFLDRDAIRVDMSMEEVLTEKIMQCTKEEQPELWENCSPINHISADAPPMFMVQGTHDSLVWVEEARAFVAALQASSKQAVVYGELPGCQHGFEVFHSPRTSHTINAVTDFLEWSHASWLKAQP